MIVPRLTSYQAAAMYNPFDHFAMIGGVGIGKSYTGSHFALKHLIDYPECWGLVGANSYDQLSQASLREFLFWLDYYKMEYVSDIRPPASWGMRKQLKSYRNTLSIRVGKHVPTIFTRILAKPNPLRGIEFSWYWIDESRDTPKNTHEVILSRMRESELIKGLVTTTPNTLDWVYQTFVQGHIMGQRTYGAMHVPTIEAVRAGIISRRYYDQLVRSYSLQMVLQELWAMHVNALQGRAYHAAGDLNKSVCAPWGDAVPSRQRPLIVACDFNYSPAPCVWVVGQRGPATSGPAGEWWPDHIHWFGEISMTAQSTRTMARGLLARYPGFFYRFFGDASGNRATTANAGLTDFIQIGEEMDKVGCVYSKQVDDSNPKVRERVETVNAILMNGAGESLMTYNPVMCPHLDGDLQVVGWTQTGKLDDCGDSKRTHGSDAVGYYCYKEMPMGRRAIMTAGTNTRSIAAETLEDVL